MRWDYNLYVEKVSMLIKTRWKQTQKKTNIYELKRSNND